MIEIKKPRMLYLRDSHQDPRKYGKFVVEPLERGFGTTLGNSLRRVLLSSLPGDAVTAVNMRYRDFTLLTCTEPRCGSTFELKEHPGLKEGSTCGRELRDTGEKCKGKLGHVEQVVLHEFSTIRGVREDVTEIVLNVKQIIAKLDGIATATATLTAKGSGDVRAGDLKTPTGLEILSKDLVLFTLDESVEISIDLTIERGRGYVPADKNQKPDQDFHTLVVDSMFSPVLRVKYAVEDARVGHEINFDRLVLEIWTNGAMTPDEATSLASQFLSDHLALFIDHVQRPTVMVPSDVPPVNKNVDIPIKDLELSVRSRNCLKRTNIKTIGELATKSVAELLELKNFGTKSLQEIREKLKEYGLSLKDDTGAPIVAAA